MQFYKTNAQKDARSQLHSVSWDAGKCWQISACYCTQRLSRSRKSAMMGSRSEKALVQIGGVRAPSPVGELGNVEMTQATELAETRWECIGRDMLLTGILDCQELM